MNLLHHNQTLPTRTSRRLSLILSACVYLALLLLFRLTPITHDDFWYVSLTPINVITTSTAQWYHNLNGRVLGNLLEGITGCSRLLRAALEALFVFGIWFLGRRILRLSTLSSGFWLAFILLVKPTLYAQTYGWGAGFFNYVPELTLLFLVFLILRCGKLPSFRKSALCSAAVLLLCICMQLFSESVTAVNILLGIALIVYGLLRRRQSGLLPVFAGAGLLIGAALMFASPSYWNGSYYTAADSGIFSTLLENYRMVSNYCLGYNFYAQLPITISCTILLIRNRDRLSHRLFVVLLGILLCCQFYFIAYHMILQDTIAYKHRLFNFCLDFAVNAAYVLCSIYCIRRLIADSCLRGIAIGAMVLGILYAGPLLVVSPIGPRCFYSTWILMLLSGFACAEYVLKTSGLPEFPVKSLRCIGTGLAACVLLVFLFIGYENNRVYSARIETAEAEITSGADTIALPQYPYPAYIWEADSQSIGRVYYHETPYDVTYDFYAYATETY